MEGVAEKYNSEEFKGLARIVKFNISKEESRNHNMFSIFRREPYFMRVEDGTFVKLIVDGVLMMSDTHMERRTNREFVSKAHGDVMIAGLGIGLILNALEDKVKSGEVKSITVYEKYQDVIDLVLPKYKHLPIKVICKDILEYKPEKGETYDTIYFDIWPVIGEDNMKDIRMLHNRWKFRKRNGGYMDSWMKSYIQKAYRS